VYTPDILGATQGGFSVGGRIHEDRSIGLSTTAVLNLLFKDQHTRSQVRKLKFKFRWLVV
jgi:hypothetical protein